MTLEQIGFYTLSDARAATASATSRLMRCELILTGRCNFRCPYCRRVGGSDLPFGQAAATIRLWADRGLYAIRFSGGEPTLYPGLMDLVLLSKLAGVKRIAISTNGSAPFEVYGELLDAGVNDLSISLDACCSADGEIMTGRAGEWEEVIENILDLAPFVYLTVGVVLSGQNMARAGEIIQFAADLGASDIRVIPAAQNGAHLGEIAVDPSLLERFPILRYRIENMRARRPVRGLRETDSQRCGLSVDDMAVCGNQHFPCIIYMREGGAAIGAVGPEMRQERAHWSGEHDTHADPICRKNCLDVCVQYNNTFAALNPKAVVSPDYPLPASAKTRIVAPDAP